MLEFLLRNKRAIVLPRFSIQLMESEAKARADLQGVTFWIVTAMEVKS